MITPFKNTACELQTESKATRSGVPAPQILPRALERYSQHHSMWLEEEDVCGELPAVIIELEQEEAISDIGGLRNLALRHVSVQNQKP